MKRKHTMPGGLGKGKLVRDYDLAEMSNIFETVYSTGIWKPNTEYQFGAEKEYLNENSVNWIKRLNRILVDKKIKSVVDFGCGPFNIYNDVNWPKDLIYTGYDVTEIPLKIARERAPNSNFTFELNTDFTSIKSADLLIVKEVFQHWPERHVKTFFQNNLHKYKHIAVVGASSNSVSPDYFPYDLHEKISAACSLFFKSNV